MAFLVVQHLEPSHDSLLAELLAPHTRMAVCEAVQYMPIEPNSVYICPPGHFMAVQSNTLHLSLPHPDHGARLPIDVLLRSLIKTDAARTICVVLSGTGADGSNGLVELKQQGGHAIAQDPDEAEYDGMPSSAVATGAIDAILPIAQIPAKLVQLALQITREQPPVSTALTDPDSLEIPAIIAVLQQQTGQNFTAYKPGTLRRRIQRRMGLSGVSTGDYRGYLAKLEEDITECRNLAEDLLINVTRFFRDPDVFALLEREIIPALIEQLPADRALRIWVVGCSTGEEAYSIAMICRDAIMAARRDIKLQVFAADSDAKAIAVAREGIYPLSIKDDVPADRLARYFIAEDDHYRVTSALRGTVVFTVQDVLHDPPFSRIDLVSCRNMLIYLKPDAQAKVIGLFHFALRERGILLLGSAETPGRISNRFEVLHKAERIYRHIARSQASDASFPLSFAESIPRLTAHDGRQKLSRQTVLAELSRDLAVDSFAPASVLIDAKRQCLYSFGPVSRYLRVAAGPPTLDLLALAPPDLRATLRYAIGKTNLDQPVFETRLCQSVIDGQTLSFTVQVRFLTSAGEELHLVSFVEAPIVQSGGVASDEASRAHILQLERELEAAHAELQRAIQNTDALVLEQKAINDEAMAVNEEFQSTNEELLTSKEELQSLNEELITLNEQLQETLDRQRIASDDLQNVLYSTNVATLFLDMALCIRFFTPATRAIFNVIPGDIGRPLSDLHSLAGDDALLSDAAQVLEQRSTIQREVGVPDGRWFLRRIFPYRTHDDRVEGVVITFVDITEPRKIAQALDQARQEAERSNRVKSRFLAVASHDLRQPLQSLKLVGELLRKSVHDSPSKELLGRLDHSLEAMSDMLDALLDINQIEAGVIATNPGDFPVGRVLKQLDAEFQPLAKAQGLRLRIIEGSAMLRSDPVLLSVMLRNLLANALKYTISGGVLVGCRHGGDHVRIEVWDTGIGIPADQLPRIFDEFHQVANLAHERAHGFGLGLSIVWQLGLLLGHPVTVRSWPGKGSVFSITVPTSTAPLLADPHTTAGPGGGAAIAPHCAIALIEDDPEVRELLARLLTSDGHSVTAAPNGPSALAQLEGRAIRPDIVLTDYNLPGGMTGLEVLAQIRSRLQENIPGLILTGDISIETLAEIERADCIGLSKPVSPADLYAAIGQLAPPFVRSASPPRIGADARHHRIICVVEDNNEMGAAIREVLEHDNRSVVIYPSAEAFLADYVADRDLCLIVDATLPGMSGIDLIDRLRQQGDPVPAILITGDGDITLAVQAMRSGASDFIEKPVSRAMLIASIDRAISLAAAGPPRSQQSDEVKARLAKLTARQKVVMDLVLAGHPSKNIAADLGVSQRTVESHRAEIMHKLGVRTIPDLVRLVLSVPTG
ncbi:MAG: hypothetical protein RLZZ84_1406 [Pseudomonadota bacterium]